MISCEYTLGNQASQSIGRGRFNFIVKDKPALGKTMTDALADGSAVTPAVTSSTGVTPASSAKRPTPSPAGTAKKRPYRRTKRPKNYCDKSTVTTTTPTLANQPVNVYDAVLGECEDLLKASLEAQRLGRLKMASAYQLLLHTRLVGLGKRFDQASIMPPLGRIKNSGETNGENENEIEDEDDHDDEDGDDDDEEHDEVSDNGHHRVRAARGGGLQMDDADSVRPTPSATTSSNRRNGTSVVAPIVKAPTKVANFPTALEKLSEILPSNFEMDTSMMEHLARAAVELHHQRTGRKKSADGLLASPVTGLIGTSPAPTAAPVASSSIDSKPSTKRDNTKIAWTPEEQQIVEKAVAEKKAPYAIAKLLKNKTEAQVKAFLKNQAKTSEQTDALADDLESPSKKRGGRGRKPPTTAMNTVPNANLDAKSLLHGVLKRG